jgi:serine/threonine protein kinase
MRTAPPAFGKPPTMFSTAPDVLPAGTRFGEFEVMRVLGVGGFGIVYLARDRSLERDVALKEYMPLSLAVRGPDARVAVPSSAFAETYATGLSSFINEARLLARFDHPSLMKVYRLWEDNATAYMVMPYVQGVTLREARRSMTHAPHEAWIRSAIDPILDALELLHREGVFHRDIAPDNILLPPNAPPLLLDLGAAGGVAGDRAPCPTAMLKPSYAPIEQYANMTDLPQGPWTDLYALGAVMHYLLFGVPPSPSTTRAVQDASDSIAGRSVPGVSPRLLEAVAWALAVQPADRPQSAAEMRAALAGRIAIAADGPTTITSPGKPTSTWPGGVFDRFTRHGVASACEP